MEPINTHHARTGDDLQYFANIVGAPGHLPQLPLHEYGPLNIQFSVIEGTAADKAEQFAAIAKDMRRIATDQALKYSEGTTSITSAAKHHRATLIMPQGKVTYTAVWIERGQQAATDA